MLMTAIAATTKPSKKPQAIIKGHEKMIPFHTISHKPTEHPFVRGIRLSTLSV